MAVFRTRLHDLTCRKCGEKIAHRDYVSWSKGERGVFYHARCMGERTPDEPTPAPDAPAPPPQPAPQPSPDAPAPGVTVSDEHIAAIADRVAVGRDVQLMVAVHEAIAAAQPTEIVVNLPDEHGKPVKPLRIPGAHPQLARLIFLVAQGEHVYLYGEPGSGKSTGAAMAARALKRRFACISLNAQTPESRLFGHPTAGGGYVETEFIRCYRDGGVFCIDEVDNAHPALLNTLNGALEKDDQGKGRLGLPHAIVDRHPDFVLVGTGNTTMRGGDKRFAERRRGDGAFIDRFTYLHWPVDSRVEARVTHGICPDTRGTAWLAWVRKVRAYVAREGIDLWASPRAAFKGAGYIAAGWDNASDVADAVVFKGIDADTRTRIVNACPLPTLAAPTPITPAEASAQEAE